jgi:hypothetical protein
MVESKQARIGATVVTARCDELLAPQAEWLLGLLARLFGQGVAIEVGRRIEFGWSMLTFKSDGLGGLVVCEPDFSANPFLDVRDDLSCTLRVQEAQSAFARHLKVSIAPASFQTKVVIRKGCLAAKRIYLERNAGASKADSGWYVGPCDADEEEPVLEALYVYELLHRRPEVMQCLGIPPGHMVVFDGKRIEAVLDAGNRNILT